MSLFFELPPVGEPILSGHCRTGVRIADFFPGCQTAEYGSGTSALAAAVTAAMRVTGKRNAEVILPAYACPNLVSAILCAGAKPVLVDLAQQRPWLDLDSVDRALGPCTVAVIAVNFLGIRERISALKSLAARAGALLIEDSAQAFPDAVESDLMILSFGRGKPVSLLGGGMVLVRDPLVASKLPQGTGRPGLGLQQWRIKRLLHNLLIHPRIYGSVRRMPFLHIGETRFVPLREIAAAGPHLAGHLGSNIAAYQSRTGDTQRLLSQSIVQRAESAVVDLPVVCSNSPGARLLRYPLLIRDKLFREKILQTLETEGLGVSRLYRVTLPDIAGLEKMWDGPQKFPHAQEFAEQLITLPTHSRVNADVRAALAEALARRLP